MPAQCWARMPLTSLRFVATLLVLLPAPAHAGPQAASAPPSTAQTEGVYSSRLFFGATARPLKRGEGYLAFHALFAPGLQVGVTDRISKRPIGISIARRGPGRSARKSADEAIVVGSRGPAIMRLTAPARHGKTSATVSRSCHSSLSTDEPQGRAGMPASPPHVGPEEPTSKTAESRCRSRG